jgi:hypothetical protein
VAFVHRRYYPIGVYSAMECSPARLIGCAFKADPFADNSSSLPVVRNLLNFPSISAASSHLNGLDSFRSRATGLVPLEGLPIAR